ncbi:hypothetical protein LZG00_00145 [Rhodobacteraceae bacterium LMO-12]|nr:hypothetical protein [Rhodobacteraceae bacterium LMO-JJ12]
MADKRKKNETPETEAEDIAEINKEDGADTQDDAPAPQEDLSIPDEAEADAQATDDQPHANPEPSEDTPEASSDEDPAEETDTVSDAEETPTPLPVVTPEPVVIRKGGFFPMLLGGVAAAAIGFGAARYVLPEGWPWPGADDGTFEADVTAQLEAQSKALADLQAEAGKAPDFSPLQADIAGAQSRIDELSEQINGANARLDAFETRLTDLEKRPITEGASPAAVAAYERELKALQEAMAAQRAEVEEIAAIAAEKEANAEKVAQQALQRAALGRILSALDSGEGFADAAATLQDAGIDLPPGLSRVAAEGVASRSQLAQAFPEAARAALAVARKSEDGGGLGAFLKTQLGARSLEPREGDDPDAVLSRAEAAMNEGRLDAAITELDALPEDARAEMSEWLSLAATRAAALKAADALASELN